MWRLGADLLFTNLSMAAAFCGWFGYYAAFRPATDLVQLRCYYGQLYRDNVLLWSVTFLAVFALHGFYTRSRTYRGRHRLVVVAQAIATAFLAFLFASYFLLRTAIIPRGVMLAGLLLTLLMVGGAMSFTTTNGESDVTRPQIVLPTAPPPIVTSCHVPPS